MKIIKIKADQWLQGNFLAQNPGLTSSLFNPVHNRMCCLGFLCIQAVGFTRNEIRDRSDPEEMMIDGEPRSQEFYSLKLIEQISDDDFYPYRDEESFYNYNTHLSAELMKVNDLREEISLEDRVKKLNEVCEEFYAPFRFELEK